MRTTLEIIVFLFTAITAHRTGWERGIAHSWYINHFPSNENEEPRGHNQGQ